MATIESLPADQRAVIQLVLQQGRSYDDIAAMLSIDRAGVRQRALDAFDALGPDNSIPAPQRALLTDYLLGQLPGRVADQVHDGIADSPAQRAWLRVVASEVGALATGGLPAIPSSRPSAPARPTPAEPARTTRAEPALPVQAAPAAAPAREAGTGRRGDTGRGAGAGRGAADGQSSRRGGAILLGLGAVLVIAVVVAVLLLTGGGSSNSHNVASSGATTPSTPASTAGTTTGTSTTKAKLLAHVNLNSPSGVKNRAGVAQVVGQGSTLGVLIIAQKMPANSKTNAYALWLFNSNSDSKLVGFVNARVSANGRLETEGVLPANTGHYKHMLITLETQQRPKTPGPIVLEGNLNLS